MPFSSHPLPISASLICLDHSKLLLSTQASNPQLPLSGSLNSFSIPPPLTIIHVVFLFQCLSLTTPTSFKSWSLNSLDFAASAHHLNSIFSYLPSKLRSFSSTSPTTISIVGGADNHSSKVYLSVTQGPVSYTTSAWLWLSFTEETSV